MEVKLYVATHKSYNQVQDQDIYIPILVGANKNIGEKNYLRDGNSVFMAMLIRLNKSNLSTILPLKSGKNAD